MKKSELKQQIREEFTKALLAKDKDFAIDFNKLLKENTHTPPKNKYAKTDGDTYTDGSLVYFIDKDKALEYLSQFNADDIDAETYINDDEGWGEFEQYLDPIEQMTDEELEDAMRQDLSFYYFSNGDSI